MRNALTIAVGTAAGFALGYAVCKLHLEQTYQEKANSEITELKEYYEKRMKKEVSDAVGIAVQDYEAWLAEQEEAYSKKAADTIIEQVEVEEYVERVGVYASIPTDTPVTAATPVSQKVDYAAMSRTTPRPAPAHAAGPAELDEPHVITEQDFFSSTSEEQPTLTYYSDDDVLATQDDRVIEGEERRMAVGTILEKFVPKTGDDNVLYIRSPKLGQEFEVIRSEGSFTKEALGLGDDTAS